MFNQPNPASNVGAYTFPDMIPRLVPYRRAPPPSGHATSAIADDSVNPFIRLAYCTLPPLAGERV